MVNLDELAGKDLQNIGDKVLAELNINLFNAEPTIHKAYQIYVEMVHAGYMEKNKQLACEKIKHFFNIRTVRNQRKEFQMHFGIPFTDDMRSMFSLSFRTSVIAPEVIRKASVRSYRILSGLDLGQNLNIDESILYASVAELFKPQYNENEWRITIPVLFGKIKKNLIARGEGHLADSLEEIFYLIDPNPKKKKLRGLKLMRGSIDPDVTGGKPQSDIANESKDMKRLNLVGTMAPVGAFDEILQTRANVIKESELEYVRATLELVNGDEVQEALSIDLYQNDKRHPLVKNFLNSAKAYNRIMSAKDVNLKDTLVELKVVVRALREIGAEVERSCQGVVGRRVQDLQSDIKNAG